VLPASVYGRLGKASLDLASPRIVSRFPLGLTGNGETREFKVLTPGGRVVLHCV
jgi:hypothetical protein